LDRLLEVSRLLRDYGNVYGIAFVNDQALQEKGFRPPRASKGIPFATSLLTPLKAIVNEKQEVVDDWLFFEHRYLTELEANIQNQTEGNVRLILAGVGDPQVVGSARKLLLEMFEQPNGRTPGDSKIMIKDAIKTLKQKIQAEKLNKRANM
jgi:hypothetical protein